MAAAIATTAAATVIALDPAANAQQGTPPQPGAGASSTGTSAKGVTSDRGLGDVDRARVHDARRKGDTRVTLLIAAEEGRLDAAIAQTRALGGRVEKTDRKVDYLKVSVPVGNAERAARASAIEAVDVDGLVPMDDPRPEGAQSPVPQAPPNATTPRANPYMPTQDTGAAQWVNDNPTFDGRGATIAILDSGIDLDHPSVNTTSTGERKIVDWYNANSPISGDATWLSMTGTHAAGAPFDAPAGTTWTPPATGGPYAFAVLDENRGELNTGETEGDVDRDGTPGENIGVLFDRTSKEVLVDTDQDRDFTDETRMTDYKDKFDVGALGTDDAATPVREQMPFVVVTDRADPAAAGVTVNIGIPGAAHGTHVAGITAANDMFGGGMSGAAPGAKLIAVKVCLTTPSCTSSGLIEGMIYAGNSGADVANLSVGGLPGLNDGDNMRAELYNRIIDETGMQIFISAGNSGPGSNTVGDPSVTTKAMTVAASITRETWEKNYGSIVTRPFAMMPFSSRGPREDGLLKPQVTAPGAAISTIPTWQEGAPVAGAMTLPPGYGMFNGTSMAAPQAAGAAALLVGRAKAAGMGAPTPAALRNAIMSGADFRPGIGAHEQGAGVFDVDAAWAVLAAEGGEPHTISASVPVNTVLSHQLATPDVGTGIHDREGVTTGTPYTRTYTLKRTSGPAGPVTFDVSWRGNDGGVFDAPATVTLGLNEPTEFVVGIDPATPGIHSAILLLDDPATDGVDHQAMNTVYAPHALTDGKATFTGTVDRNASRHFLVRVPADAGALTVDLAGGGSDPGAGQIRFLRYSPQGLPIDPTASTSCYTPDAGTGCGGGTPNRRIAIAPIAGVWEITVEARRTSDVETAPFKLDVNVLDTETTPRPDDASAQTAVTSLTRTYRHVNVGGDFVGRTVAGGSLAARQSQRPTVGDGAIVDRFVTIPAGVSNWTIRTSNPSDTTADVDMSVHRCTAPDTCPVLVGASETGTSNETVSVNNPTPSLYRIRLHGFGVPAGSTQLDLVDAYTSSALGAVTSTDADAPHPAGSTWTSEATLTTLAPAPADRQLVGSIRVVTADDITLENVEVTFRVDTDDPQTTIDAAPPATTNDATPTFEFSADEPGVTFACTLAPTPLPDSKCASGLTTEALADGTYTFTVTAMDGAGNTDDTPAETTFEVDTVAPTVSIDDGPAGATTDRTPTFAFSSPDPESDFECSIDGEAFSPCSSTFTTPELADGANHTFAVRATDDASNRGLAATSAFAVTAPTALTAATAQAVSYGAAYDSATFTATLTHATSGAGIAGQVVRFTLDGAPLCVDATEADGTASCTAPLPAGAAATDRVYAASYAGEPRFAAAAATGQLLKSAGPPDGPEPSPTASPSSTASPAPPAPPAMVPIVVPPVIVPPATCRSTRSFRATVHSRRSGTTGLRIHGSISGVRITSAVLNDSSGDRVRTLRRRGRTVIVNMVGLTRGTYTVVVKVRRRDGRTATATKRYQTCMVRA